MTEPQLFHAISWLTSSPGFLSYGSHPICHINSPHTNPLHHTSLFNDIYIFLTNLYEISHPKKLNLQRTSAPWLTGDYITLETQCLLGHSDTASQASESDGTALLPYYPIIYFTSVFPSCRISTTGAHRQNAHAMWEQIRITAFHCVCSCGSV